MHRPAPFPPGVLALALAFAATPAPAGSAAPDSTLGAVAGRVLAAGRPAAYPHTRILGTRRGAMGDEAGRFRIDGVPSGPRRLLVQMIGFERRLVDVAVAAGRVESVLVDLGSELFTQPRRQFTPDASARAAVGSRCPRHRAVRLALDTVSKQTGLIVVPRGFPEARARRFPNANSGVDAGSCDPRDGGLIETAFCAACRREETRWFERGRAVR